MEADELLKALGGQGRYQIQIYLSLCLVYMRGAWHAFAIMFLGGDPGHQCNLASAAGNKSYHDGQCHMTVEKNGVNFTETCIYGMEYGRDNFDSTILTEFNLVCERDYMVDLSSTIYMVGSALGAVMITPFSDRFGRKWSLLLTLWLQGVIGACVMFSGNYVVFTTLRFFVGFLNMAIALITYVMITEIFPSNIRTVSVSASFFWSMGIISLALFGHLVRDWKHLELLISLPNFLTVIYIWQKKKMLMVQGIISLALFGHLVRDWKHLELLISLPNFLTVIYIWTLPESIPWMVSKRRTKQLKNALNSAAKINNIELPQDLLDKVEEHGSNKNSNSRTPEQSVNSSKTNVTTSGQSQSTLMADSHEEQTCDLKNKTTVLDLFKTPIIRRYTLIMFYLWFVNSLGYFGTMFSTPMLNGNIFVNLAISGAVEIPAIVICILVLERVGRRKPLVCFMFLCGAMNIAAAFVPKETADGTSLEPLIITLAMIGKFGITGSYSTVYLMSSEIFPTIVRNQAVGLSSFCENTGSIAAPFIVYGAKNLAQMPLVLFGVLTAIHSILAVFLPETLKHSLPETIQDVEAKNLAQMPLVLFGVLTVIGSILAVFLPETHKHALPETIQDVEGRKINNNTPADQYITTVSTGERL